MEEDNRKLSKLIENVLNDPKNHIEVGGQDKEKELKDHKDFSTTFFNKNRESNILDEKDEKNNTMDVGFNGANKTSNLPTINMSNLIKLKEVS